MRATALLAATLALLLSCTGLPYQADIYITTADGSQLFRHQPDGNAGPFDGECVTVEIGASLATPAITGFGPALTGASCYNLLKMSPEARQSLLKELFDPADGLGFSLIRCSIGASDFSVDEDFTWCDTPGLEHFAVHPEDRDYLFPILREVYAINPDVRIIGSPWSPPRWMKRESVDDDSDHYDWRGGSLKPECYKEYAAYFVRWIQTLQSEGFRVFAVTPQNEPLHPGNSMSLYMTWQEQAAFIGTALGPALAEAGLDTKILVFDHNYNYDRIPDQRDYPLHVMADSLASRYVAGSAWHNYGGHVSELDHIRAAAPDKDIYFTEASIGMWNYDFSKRVLGDFESIFMGTLARGCQGVTLWNLALDENRRPFRPGGCSTCFGVITLSSETGEVLSRNSQYYDLAHCSKVIKRGAMMLGCKGPETGSLQCQAFANPDGTLAVLLLNKEEHTRSIEIRRSGKLLARCVSPAGSIVSVSLHR